MATPAEMAVVTEDGASPRAPCPRNARWLSWYDRRPPMPARHHAAPCARELVIFQQRGGICPPTFGPPPRTFHRVRRSNGQELLAAAGSGVRLQGRVHPRAAASCSTPVALPETGHRLRNCPPAKDLVKCRGGLQVVTKKTASPSFSVPRPQKCGSWVSSQV